MPPSLLFFSEEALYDYKGQGAVHLWEVSYLSTTHKVKVNGILFYSYNI